MLVATTTHPAMASTSTTRPSQRPASTKSLGREFSATHRRRRVGYSEDEVRSSAHIITGRRVDRWDSWEPYYSPGDHWTGSVKVFGFSNDNPDPDGRTLTVRYLRYLANHPATAQRIAHRLCVRFRTQ